MKAMTFERRIALYRDDNFVGLKLVDMTHSESVPPCINVLCWKAGLILRQDHWYRYEVSRFNPDAEPIVEEVADQLEARGFVILPPLVWWF